MLNSFAGLVEGFLRKLDRILPDLELLEPVKDEEKGTRLSMHRLPGREMLLVLVAANLGGGVCIVFLRVRIRGGGGCIMAVGLQSACVQFNLVVAILFEMYG